MIHYDFELVNSILKLNNYFLTSPEFLKQDVKVEVTVYIPEDQIIYLDKNLMDFSRVRNFKRSDYNTFLGYDENTWKPIDSIIKIDTLSTQN